MNQKMENKMIRIINMQNALAKNTYLGVETKKKKNSNIHNSNWSLVACIQEDFDFQDWLVDLLCLVNYLLVFTVYISFQH